MSLCILALGCNEAQNFPLVCGQKAFNSGLKDSRSYIHNYTVHTLGNSLKLKTDPLADTMTKRRQ